MAWHIIFCGPKLGLYESWGICSEYVLDFSGATY
jgi:hypothetical protein